MKGGIFRDEHGFTTTSMVLSLLITLALVFSAAQVYRINSASAEVQDVADAAALAAENQVAEFMVIARFCDAVVLSLSLTGLTVTGLGIAALCTPATAAVSVELVNAGRTVLKARNEFADRAANVLNKLQEALPYLAAACAAGVSRANNEGSPNASYLGVAMLVPVKGEAIGAASAAKADDLLGDIESQADEIREQAKRAEEAAEQANRAKQRAFQRDCGDDPGYCMYERAARLAGLTGGDNPLYASVDTWSFSVALDRAKAYYRARYLNEAPADDSIAEQARSALRSHFYRYVNDEMKGAYVHETADSFQANFPRFPSNTAEMRLTRLYTDEVYPLTTMQVEGEQVQVMHAWMGCPEVQAAGVDALGSIAYLEEADLPTCPTCGFTASSMGRVASASSSIPNGFEYHYEAVAEEALLYETARKEADGPREEVKGEAGSLFDELVEAAKEMADMRIQPSPPGRYGAIAFVVNAGSTPAAGPWASSFVTASGSLGPRAAVGAATLLDEGSDEGRTVVNSLLDGLREGGGAAVGAAGMVLDAWSWMLTAYADGQDALTSGVRNVLDSLPLVGASGLGSWAAGKLTDALDAVGLQPAEMGALKPVLVNSAHVAAKDGGSFASGYLSLKQRIVAHPLMSGDLFSSLLTEAEASALEQVQGLGGSVEIASIELLGEGGPSLPITIPLPEAAKAQGASAISDLFARLRQYHAQTTGERVWE